MTRDEMREQKRAELQRKKRSDYYADPYAMPPECDPCCRFRSCYSKYHDKGPFAYGRGYTSYTDKFYPACGTRLSHGCPSTKNRAGDSFNMEAALKWVADELGKSQNPTNKAKDRRLAFANARWTLANMVVWQKKRNEQEKGVINDTL